MANKNLPNIPIYIGDWERDCNVLSLQAEMAWMKIIFKMHLAGKQSNYKVSAKGLQRLWKSDANEVNEIMKELLFEDICEISEIPGGFIFTCRRLKKENEISEVRSKVAKDRWNKEKKDAKPKQKKSKRVQNTDNDIDNDNESENKDENEKEDCKGEKTEFQEVVNQFNEICKELPSVQKITDTRRKAIKNRIAEYKPENVPIFFESVFNLIAESHFLNGDNDRGWKADFDWIMKHSNFIKIIEKNYSNHGKTSKNKPKYSEDFKRRIAEQMGAS